MASLVDQLQADRPRYRRALAGLIAEQEAALRRLTADLTEAQALLDRAVLKLVLFSEQFGRASAETAGAQREAEEANSRTSELARKLEKQTAVMQLYRQRWAQAEDHPSPLSAEQTGEAARVG